MTNQDVYDAYKAQYRAIDDNLDELAKAAVTFAQQQQLSDAWTAAQTNYTNARNRLFDEDSQEVGDLVKQMQQAQTEIDASLTDLKDIASTLNQITSAVSVGTSLLALIAV